MQMPKEVTISKDHVIKLRQLEKKKRALNQVIQMITKQGEEEMLKYNNLASEIWTEIQKATGVDLENVLWVPHPTEDKIVPVQVRLNYNSSVESAANVN